MPICWQLSDQSLILGLLARAYFGSFLSENPQRAWVVTHCLEHNLGRADPPLAHRTQTSRGPVLQRFDQEETC